MARVRLVTRLVSHMLSRGVLVPGVKTLLPVSSCPVGENGMQVFRQHRYFRWLGLLAMALQLILSFGHHHDHTAKHLTSSSDIAARGIEVPGWGTTQTSSTHDSDDDEGHCAICWTMAIAGTLTLGMVVWNIVTLSYMQIEQKKLATK